MKKKTLYLTSAILFFIVFFLGIVLLRYSSIVNLQSIIVTPSAYAVPVSIREPSGINRNHHISYGFPLPSTTQITEVSNCRVLLYNSNSQDYSEIPSQFKILSRWGDLNDLSKSLRWTLVTHEVNLNPGEINNNYYVDCAPNIIRQVSPSLPLTILTNNVNELRIDTGTAQFKISKTNFNILDEIIVNGKQVISSGTNKGIDIVNQDGSQSINLGAPASVSILEQGQLKTIVKIEDNFNSGGNSLKIIVYLTFFSSKSYVDMRYDLINEGNFGHPSPYDLSSPIGDNAQPAYFKRNGVRFNVNLNAGSQGNAYFGIDEYSFNYGGASPPAPNNPSFVLTQRSLPPSNDFIYRNPFIEGNNLIPPDSTQSDIIDNMFEQLFIPSTSPTTFNNKRFNDVIGVQDFEKGLAFGGRYLWERQPKDWAVEEGNQVLIDLWPDASHTPQYTYEPFYRTSLNNGYDPDFSNANQLSNLIDSISYDISNPIIGGGGNHIFPGGIKVTYDLWIRPYESNENNFEPYDAIAKEFKAWNNPIIATPLNPDYIDATNALGIPFSAKKDWDIFAPPSMDIAFDRFEQFANTQVDNNAVSSGFGQSNYYLWDCMYFILTRGSTYDGHRTYGWKDFGDSYWDGTAGFSNNHYGILEQLLFWRNPSEYRFLQFGLLKELHQRTIGTKWYYSERGLKYYEKGIYRSAEIQKGSHQWYLSHYLNFLQSGDIGSLEPIISAADTILSFPVQATYVNEGGARILAGQLRPLNIAYLITGKQVYKSAIQSRIYSVAAGEQAAETGSCGLSGVLPNIYETSYYGSCATTPWMQDFLLQEMILGYQITEMNDASIIDLFEDIVNHNWDYGIVDGTGNSNNYLPHNQCQRIGSIPGICLGIDGKSRLNIPAMALSLVRVHEITNNPVYLERATTLAEEWSKWGWLSSEQIIDMANANYFFANTCRSLYYPNTHNKDRNFHLDMMSQVFATISKDYLCSINSIEVCGDYLDNNCNGLIDCYDSECGSSSFCNDIPLFIPSAPSNLQTTIV